MTEFGEGNGTPLQYSCLENAMGGGAWWAAVHGVARSWTRLSDFTFTFHFHALEKAMATHSSVLAWRIPGTGEPGGLLSMGSHRVGHDWSDLAASPNMYRQHTWLDGQTLSYHFLFSIFFSGVNRSSLHKKHLIVYSYSGLHFCKLFLHLWDGPDDINTCSQKSGVLWWGGEKSVKWATFA